MLAVGTAKLPALLGACDLTPQLLADDDVRISPAQFCVAWAEAMRLSERSAARARDRRGHAARCVRHRRIRVPLVADARRGAAPLGALPEPARRRRRGRARDRRRARVLARDARERGASAGVARAVLRAGRAPGRAAVDGAVSRRRGRLRHRGDPARYRAWFDAPIAFGAEHTQLVMPASRARGEPRLERSGAARDPRARRRRARAQRAGAADARGTGRARLREALRGDDGGSRSRREAARPDVAQLAAPAQGRRHVVQRRPRARAPRARDALPRRQARDRRDLVPARLLGAERVLPRVQALDRHDAARSTPPLATT